MNIDKIHFIREILVSDYRDGDTATMQISDDNASYLTPNFSAVPSVDQEQIRGLYRELGGGRREGSYIGSTVVIPNRSFWASLRRISPDEVRVVEGVGQGR